MNHYTQTYISSLLALLLSFFCTQNAFSQEDIRLLSAKNYFQQGDYANCQKVLFPTFLDLRKTKGENNATFQESLSLLADLVTKIGYYSLAERIAFKDLSLCMRLYGKKDVRTAKAILRLGDISRFKTNYENAKLHYDDANEICAEIPNNELFVAEIQVHEGQLLREKGEYTAAETLFRKANIAYQKLGLSPSDFRQIELNEGYATLYMALRNYAKAVQLLESNLFLLQKFYHPSHPNIAENHHQLAEIYLKAGLKEKGQLHLDSAKQQTYLTPELYLLNQKQKADLLKQQNNFSQADTIYRQLLENTSELAGEHSRLKMDFMAEEAKMYYQMGNYEEAIALLERIEDLQKDYLNIAHPDYLQTLQDLSLVHWASGNDKKTLRYFSSSAERLLEQFRKASSFMSEQEKTLFYEESRRFFDRFNAFIVANHQKQPSLSRVMYDHQLQTKALLFSSALILRDKVMTTKDSTLIKHYFKWLAGKEQLAKIYKLTSEGVEVSPYLLDSLENTLNDWEKNIQLKVALNETKYGSLKDKITSSTLRPKLNPTEAVVEIVRVQGFSPYKGGRETDTLYYAALILTAKTPNPELVLFSNGNLLENQYMKYYKNTLIFRLQDTLSYHRYWQAIAENPALQGIKKIYLSVDGVYNKININTLYNTKTEKYLIEEIDIHLLTSTRDLFSAKNHPKKQEIPDRALLVGYPDYHNAHASENNGNTSQSPNIRRSNIEELPGTKKEIEGISKILDTGEKQTVTLFSSEATEENLKQKASAHNLLHIATHGFFSAAKANKSEATLGLQDERHENPLLRCGILLSGAANAYSKEILQNELTALLSGQKVEDGILTAYETMNLDLSKIDLVVLSACETGLGEVKNGEGVYGFQRALQTAGAKAIIMSLWKVSDETTIALMVSFYENWLRLGNKRTAFLAAQNQLRKDFPNPYFWGAFIMIGD
jgi:CHAT domain-containing protein